MMKERSRGAAAAANDTVGAATGRVGEQRQRSASGVEYCGFFAPLQAVKHAVHQPTSQHQDTAAAHTRHSSAGNGRSGGGLGRQQRGKGRVGRPARGGGRRGRCGVAGGGIQFDVLAYAMQADVRCATSRRQAAAGGGGGSGGGGQVAAGNRGRQPMSSIACSAASVSRCRPLARSPANPALLASERRAWRSMAVLNSPGGIERWQDLAARAAGEGLRSTGAHWVGRPGRFLTLSLGLESFICRFSAFNLLNNRVTSWEGQ